MVAGVAGDDVEGETNGSTIVGSSVTITGTKVGCPPVEDDTLITRRQRFSRLSWIPSFRATSFTITPERNASSEICTFSAGV